MELTCQNTITNKRKFAKIISFLAVFIVLFTVTGCGTETAEKNDTEKRVSGKKGVMEDIIKEAEIAEEGQDSEKETVKETFDDDAPVTMASLINETGESVGDSSTADYDAEPLPDTVLWFNATYAPLTYSNGGNWKIVGGFEPTDDNQHMMKLVLERDWNVEDRDSALETVERLKKDGHRKKCRECMEELKERGWLDLDEETFVQELMDSDIEENHFRYVIAYFMCHEGLDADYIAAWDLCRANQLYAHFYICGYMTYEEAMDASLENSLILQEMYPSWEEMMDSYMLGYQFWRNDPGMDDDSPTMERYQYYEMLRQTENGPYTLDWDMKLEKSW